MYLVAATYFLPITYSKFHLFQISSNIYNASWITFAIPKENSSDNYLAENKEFDGCSMYGLNSQYDFSNFDGGTKSCSVEMFDLNNKTTCNDGYIYDDTFFDETLATNLDLVCDKRSLQKLLGVIQILATIFGSILGGKLGDKFGRKNTCFLAILILGPVVTSAGFVHSYHGLYTFFGSLKSENIQTFIL